MTWKASLGAVAAGLVLAALAAPPSNAAESDTPKVEKKRVIVVGDNKGPGEKTPYLGVNLSEETQNPEGGARIESVLDDSPAEKAGLKRGDIVVGFGDAVIRGPGALTKRIHQSKAGEKVPLTFIREGKKQTLTVEIGERDQRRIVVAMPRRRRRGHHHPYARLGEARPGAAEAEGRGRVREEPGGKRETPAEARADDPAGRAPAGGRMDLRLRRPPAPRRRARGNDSRPARVPRRQAGGRSPRREDPDRDARGTISSRCCSRSTATTSSRRSPRSLGRTATWAWWGSRYPGISQLFVAQTQPPHLRAITPCRSSPTPIAARSIRGHPRLRLRARMGPGSCERGQAGRAPMGEGSHRRRSTPRAPPIRRCISSAVTCWPNPTRSVLRGGR